MAVHVGGNGTVVIPSAPTTVDEATTTVEELA